jgi:hypothetical protein
LPRARSARSSRFGIVVGIATGTIVITAIGVIAITTAVTTGGPMFIAGIVGIVTIITAIGGTIGGTGTN